MIRHCLALTYYLYALRLAALSHFYFNRLYHAPYAINVFGQLGYSRLNYKVAGDDTRANQYALGLGVNKAFSLGSATLTPEFTLSHIWRVPTVHTFPAPMMWTTAKRV